MVASTLELCIVSRAIRLLLYPVLRATYMIFMTWINTNSISHSHKGPEQNTVVLEDRAKAHFFQIKISTGEELCY